MSTETTDYRTYGMGVKPWEMTELQRRASYLRFLDRLIRSGVSDSITAQRPEALEQFRHMAEVAS